MAESDEAFQSMYEDFKHSSHPRKWSEQFTKYFDRCLMDNVKESLKWKAEELNLFGLNGVTSNCNESINDLYQRLLDKEQKPLVEAMKMAMLILVSRLEEIRRSGQGDGDLRVKAECKETLEKILPPEQENFISLDGLSEIFNEGTFSYTRPSSYVPRKEYIMSRTGLANFFVKTNRVLVIYDYLFVRGLYGELAHVRDLANDCP